MAGLHLAVLWAFAVAQPLFDLLGDSPEFFVARGNTRADILLLGFGLILLPPLLLTGIEALAGLISRRLRQGLHLALVAVLAAALALQLLDDLFGATGALILVVASAAGALAAVAYARTDAAPLLLTVLGPAPAVFLLVFLVLSPASKLVLPGGEAETADVTIPRDAPVVMIVFDELAGYALMGADGRVDAARFPNFARLARESTWYRNATTVADFTDRAVPAILTGERPDRGAVPIASDHTESLFTLLGGKYSFDVTEPVTDICPTALCPAETASRPSVGRRLRDLGSDLSLVSLHLLAPDDLAEDLPPVDRSFGGFGGGEPDDPTPDPGKGDRAFAALESVLKRREIFDAFESRLDQVPRKRHLAFLHLQMPHSPYHYLPSGQRYPETLTDLPGLESADKQAGGTWSENAWLARQAFQRYLLQLRYTDELLGRTMDRLRARGVWDRAEVVVMADHGASFRAGEPHRAATERNLAEVASIPLFVKSPGQREGRVDNSNVKSIDVLPTIASGLGIRLPWSTAGRPATRESTGGTVSVQPQFGGDDLSMPFAEFTRRRDALVSRMATDFGEGRDGLYSAGPDADLVGRRVGDLSPTLASSARFELDGAGLLASVDPSGSIVPSFITGEVSGIPSRARLAVAVDGRVAATTFPFSDDDLTRFSAIVPARAFVRGPNAVELLAITGSAGQRRLARLRGAGLSYRLARAGKRQVLIDSSGRRLAVARGSAKGQVDRVTIEAAEARIDGWAGDTKRRRRADRVLAFAGDRFLAGGRPSESNEILARRYGPGLARAGYQLRGWTAGPRPGSRRAPIRVFAVYGTRAYELAVPKPR